MMIWARKNVYIQFFLGFSSGLPLVAIGSTLQAWMTVSNVSLVKMGLFSLIGAAYTFKFIWAPLLDRFNLPWFGRRRAWMLLAQIGVFLTLLDLSFQNPAANLWTVGLVALCVAIFSATQDTAIDAYRTDLLSHDERGPGSAMLIGGYRLGVIVAGGLALIFADHYGWRATYVLLACCILVGILGALLGNKPKNELPALTSFREAVIIPFAEFLKRSKAIYILVFIVLYKLCDAFALSFISAFLIHGVGFDLAEVGQVFKIYGVVATLLGVYFGGYLMPRLGLYRSLFWFGLFQGLSNLLLMLLAHVGKNYGLFVTSIMVDSLASGMSTAAYMAFLMGLCHHRFTATQYALFSALSSVGRVFIGPVSGEVAHLFGWVVFFGISVVLVFPAILLLMYLKRFLDFEADAIR